MTEKPTIDRHVLSFKANPFVTIQRDIKFIVSGAIVNEVSYFLSYEGQVKDVTLDFTELNFNIDVLQKLIVKGKTSARNYHINSMTTGGKDFVLFDYDVESVIRCSIIDGVLVASIESLKSFQMPLSYNERMEMNKARFHEQTRVSN